MEQKNSSWAPAFFVLLGTGIFGVLIYFGITEYHYYILPLAKRPLSADHEFLRSSGKGGLTFGVVGTILILLNLTYLIRKRLITLAWLGGLRSWMAFHVMTGMTAGCLVLLHSTFWPRSALGILAMGAILIVVVTGLVGRYIYANTPRSIEGRELELAEIRQHLAEYQASLENIGMPSEFFRQSQSHTLIQGTDRGLLASLWALVAGDRELHREYAELKRFVDQSPRLHPVARQVLPLAERYLQERHWVVRYNELRSLMGGWRFLHRWLAILLVAAVASHILLAFRMGHLWIVDWARSLF